MLQVKEPLTTVIEVRLGKSQIGSMKALIFHRTLLKTFALQTNVTSSVIYGGREGTDPTNRTRHFPDGSEAIHDGS